ncbi:MAG TPA: F0F1 ATP synthase subunit A [Bacillota bacterium]|nr:F0F1 ATP synthase subunit A [Bacillota bacterium]
MTCDNTWHLGSMSLCGTTLVDTWIVMALVLIVGIFAARAASVEDPRGLGNLFEMIIDFVAGFIGVEETSTGRGRFLLMFLTTLFIFILFSNLLGIVPGLNSPTNTLNTNLGLAAVVFILVQGSGFGEKGIRYLKRFTHPGGALGYAMMPITLIEELAKPITLSMRLFGNIFAGELMIVVLLQLLNLRTFLFLGFIPHVVWLAFSIFVGVIQAFIFMVLSLAYVRQALEADEEHHAAHG